MTFGPDSSLPGRVWTSGESLWMPDVAEDERFERRHVAAGAGLHGGFACPVTADGEVLGVVEFFSREIREPDADLLEMMTTLGGQVGQSLERWRAEERLRRSERELADFFENATVGLHWVGPDGTILRANRAELDLLGYAEEEYVGRHIAEFHADQDVICDILRRLAGGGDAPRLPGPAAVQGRLDQGRADRLQRAVGGRPVRPHPLLHPGRDRAEAGRGGAAAERGAAAADRRERHRLRHLHARPGRQGRHLELGGQEPARLRGGRDRRPGRPRSLFIPEDIERGVPEQEIRKALERGRAENERWHVRKDGSRFWASGLLMPMRDGDRLVGLLKIMRDTTEQKRTEQELEVSRERLDLVVNSSEVGLWYCDLPFDKLVWNAKCKEHFGLPPDAEVTIDTFYERHPPRRPGGDPAGHRAVDRGPHRVRRRVPHGRSAGAGAVGPGHRAGVLRRGRDADAVRRHHGGRDRADPAGGGAAGGRPAEGRVPGHAGPRAAQPAGPDPQRPAPDAASRRPTATARGRAGDGRAAGRPPGPAGRRPDGRGPDQPGQDRAPQGGRGPGHRRGPGRRDGPAA